MWFISKIIIMWIDILKPRKDRQIKPDYKIKPNKKR